MQQFTQKYAIIQLLERMPVGEQFSANDWPLHTTIVDTFAVDWELPTMIRQLRQLLHAQPCIATIVGDDRLFGDNGQVRVALLKKTADLANLHNAIIQLLERGNLKLNDPQFAKEGFLPHSTVQSHARIHKGDSISFSELSIIDFFPDGDPYQRKVVATIRIGGMQR
jgi:hypothetical protein